MPPGGGWITREKVAVSQAEKEAEGRRGRGLGMVVGEEMEGGSSLQ